MKETTRNKPKIRTSKTTKTMKKMQHAASFLLIAFWLCASAFAQQSSSPAQSQPVQTQTAPAQNWNSGVPAPNPDDVNSVDDLMRAIYDVISGPAGPRNWDRFRSLFLPQARFTQTGKLPDGRVVMNTVGVEDFIKGATALFTQQPFYEHAIVNRVQTFGNVAQVFSSYASRNDPKQKPFERGINSIQLVNDGKRWWVVSILWAEERPDNPLPADFATEPAKK